MSFKIAATAPNRACWADAARGARGATTNEIAMSKIVADDANAHTRQVARAVALPFTRDEIALQIARCKELAASSVLHIHPSPHAQQSRSSTTAGWCLMLPPLAPVLCKRARRKRSRHWRFGNCLAASAKLSDHYSSAGFRCAWPEDGASVSAFSGRLLAIPLHHSQSQSVR